MRISLEEAQRLILENVTPLAPVRLPVKNALGCVLAQDVAAPLDQPPFPRSPYDGYALRSADSAGASETLPVTLTVVGRSFAGAPANVALGPGQAVRIMTGGVIPAGADCVVMQEHTDGGEETVKIFEALSPYANYCRQGEDFRAGEKLVTVGERVTAAVASVCASAGVTALCVVPRPRVGLLSTGDELQKPGTKLAPGHIFDSNAAFLSARLAELGVPALPSGPVGDEPDLLADAVFDAARLSDFVVTTGGVSVGQKDYLPATFQRIGAVTVFHGVAMKPGMPAAFAVLDDKPLLALSGNPFASAVTFELLGRWVLAKLACDQTLAPLESQGVLAQTYEKRRPCRRFLRAVLDGGAVSFPPEQQNGQMRSMIGCNCLAELPAGDAPVAAGTPVRLYIL